MTKSMLLIPALALAAVSASAGPHVATQWRSTEPVVVRAPFMNDSISPDGQAYKQTAPLDAALRGKMADGVLLIADTAGVVALASPAADGTLQMLQSRLRAARFAKGTLKVTSQLPFKVALDGAEIITKESVQRDSVSAESTATAQLRLEPEHDVTLAVKLLAYASDSVTAPGVKVEFVPDEAYDSVEVVSGPDIKRRFTLDDSEFGNRVSGLAMSPDGRWLIIKYYNYYGLNRYRVWSTLTDLKSGKVVNENLNGSVKWMPSGKQLYYTVTASEGHDLILVDPATGAETVAATSMPTDNIIWSPDEKYFVYHHYEAGVQEQGPLRRYVTPDDRQPGNRQRWFLIKYDLATGLSERLTYGNHTTSLNDISPDGRSLLITTSWDDPTTRPFYRQCIYQLDLATMTADTIVAPQPSFVNSAIYSPDGKRVLFSGSPSAFGAIGKNDGGHPIANDFDVQLYVMDLDSRNVTPLTRDFNPSVKSVNCWNAADGRVYFVGEDGFYNRIYALDPASGKIEQLPVEVDNASMSMGDRSAARLAYSGQGYEYMGRAYLYDVKRKTSTLLADPSAERIAEIELGKVDPWTFTAADGTEIDGVICYPPDFNPEKKYPLIVYYYGGTSPTQRSITQPYTPQLFASRDYVVYVVNPSGTTGYGQEFSARHVNAWGRQTADDIIEGVKKFTEAHPFVDASKVGCLGASYGGFMTQYLQTQTDIFAAAVSHAGISSVTSYWGEGYWGYSYNSVAAADSYPWSDPDLFKQGSLFQADKINTPLLLLHGTVDTNVPIGESIQIFNALKILGKPVEFISVDGENHFISDYSKRILWQNSIMAWFAKWLQDDSSWWDDLYPQRNL